MKAALNLAWLTSVAVAFLPTLLLHGILMCGYGPTRDEAFDMIVITPSVAAGAMLLIGCLLLSDYRRRSLRITVAWIPYVALGWLYYDKFLNDMGYGFSYGGAL